MTFNYELIIQAGLFLLACAFGYGVWRGFRDGVVEFRGFPVKKAVRPALFWALLVLSASAVQVLLYLAYHWPELASAQA